MAPQTPIRVFLLSGSRLLREVVGHVLRKTADILVIGARPYSIDAPVEIVESRCDVLLADSVSMLTLDSQIHDNLRSSLSQLKVVVIELDDDDNESTFSKLARRYMMGYVLKEAEVADVILAIRSLAKLEAVRRAASISYDEVPR
jgi:DNA-binding NarL/FixJ family response regulator